MAADHCVGGVENSDKYRPITATCPVHAPSGLRLSVSKAAFSTGERISFTLSQAQVSTNIGNKTRLVLLQKKKNYLSSGSCRILLIVLKFPFTGLKNILINKDIIVGQIRQWYKPMSILRLNHCSAKGHNSNITLVLTKHLSNWQTCFYNLVMVMCFWNNKVFQYWSRVRAIDQLS